MCRSGYGPLRQLRRVVPAPRYDRRPVATSPTTANGSQRSFTATYLDTEDRRLTRAGIELRRRVERGKSIWEAQIGGTTVRALVGPAQPPEELKRVLATLLRGEKI